MDHNESDALGGDRGGVIAARGTGDGLVLRLDGRVEPALLKEAMRDFMAARKSFLSGNEVSLEWVGVLPEEALVSELRDDLARDFKISVKSSRLRERISVEEVLESEPKRRVAATSESRTNSEQRNLTLFDGIDALDFDEALDEDLVRCAHTDRKDAVIDPAAFDQPDARVLVTTMRSGQKIESEHSIVIFGDVNCGAELISGGDVIVLGTLRGVAHAGAYDETGGGRVIFALNMQPTQLRIGSIISRGAEGSSKVPEIARVDEALIVVERYQARGLSRGKGI